MLEGGPVAGKFDAVYALDVLEHMRPDQDDIFLKNVVGSNTSSGVAILGMPSLESRFTLRRRAKRGTSNCKSGPDLKTTMEKLFNAVFVFSMNDEVVHAGFYPMAHYLLAVCAHPRSAE